MSERNDQSAPEDNFHDLVEGLSLPRLVLPIILNFRNQRVLYTRLNMQL